MQIKMDETKDPVSGESGLLLLLVVLGICGLLMWVALFLGVRWSVSNAWAVVFTHQAAASSAQTPSLQVSHQPDRS
jgi:hypothetical protein